MIRWVHTEFRGGGGGDIIQYEYLQSSIGFTVKITLNDDKVGI